MDSTTISKRKMKPVLYPQAFLEKKIQRKRNWDLSDAKSKFVCLMKYFPKYYKNLELLDNIPLSRSVESRIKQLKIIKKSYCSMISDSDEKTLKRLFRGCRKTLQRLPPSRDCQNPRLYQYFPRVNTVEVWRHRILYGISEEDSAKNISSRYILEEDEKNTELGSRLFWKGIKRSYGYFWSGNRYVESLKVLCENYFSLMIIKKLNNSKRFLSSLKTLELTIDCERDEETDILTRLTKNTNFLQHVTYLKIYNPRQTSKLFQPLLNCCPQCSFLSFEATSQLEGLSLSSLQNLQVLEIELSNLQTWIDRIDFLPSIRELSLSVSYTANKQLQRIIKCQDFDEDWKILDSFFEKCRKFNNLRALNLTMLSLNSNIEIMMKMFILPLLREKSQLETFNCQFYLDDYRLSEEDKLLDLEMFFEGIKSLRSIKNLSLTSPHGHFIYSPQKFLSLPNLSSLNLSAESSPKFDVSKFLKGVFHNLESKNEETSIKLSKIRLRYIQELIKLLNLLNQASEFKALQIYLEVELYIESIDEIVSISRHPIDIPSNIQLMVQIFLPDTKLENMTQRQILLQEKIPYEFQQIQSFFQQHEELFQEKEENS